MDLHSRTKKAFFHELTTRLFELRPDLSRETEKTLLAREKLLSTGIGSGVALPHTQVKGIGHPAGVLAVSKSGLDYDSLDKKPVYVAFLLIDDVSDTLNHMILLRDIALIVREKDFVNDILRAEKPAEAHDVFLKYHNLALRGMCGGRA